MHDGGSEREACEGVAIPISLFVPNTSPNTHTKLPLVYIERDPIAYALHAMRMCLGRSAIGARARAHTGSHQTTTRTLETEIADRLLLFAPRREFQLEFQQEMHTPALHPTCSMANLYKQLFPPPRAAAALCGGSDGRAVAAMATRWIVPDLGGVR